MKRLLRSRLEIPGRRVSTIFLDRRRGIRSFHQNGQQKKQQQQQHTRATAAVASCATKFRFNNSAGLLQLGYRPYLGSIAAATSSGNGGHQKGTHISNSASLVCAAVAAAAAAAAAADYPSVSTEGRRFSDVYIDVENNTLGSGSYGTVSAAVHKETGEVVAVKRIPRTPDMTLKEITAEVETLKVAGEHRNITQFYELFVDDDFYYLTMEMAKGGELFDILIDQGIPTEAQTATLMKALVGAVAYVHMHGVIHGDIKPENVFFTAASDGDVDWKGVLLGDFGSAVEVASGGRTTLSAKETRVTVAYSPPETLRAALDGDDLTVSPGGDVWALGVLLYMLLTGEHPFAPDMSVSDADIADNVMQDGKDGGEPYTPYFMQDEPPPRYEGEEGPPFTLDPLVKELLSQMLHRDSHQRPTAQQVLHHPWFRTAMAAATTTADGHAALDSTGGAAVHSTAATPLAAGEALQVFWSGRRRLKGCLLAVMAGLVDGISEAYDDDDDDDGYEDRFSGEEDDEEGEEGGGSGEGAGERRRRRRRRPARRRPSMGQGGDLERQLPAPVESIIGGGGVGDDGGLALSAASSNFPRGGGGPSGGIVSLGDVSSSGSGSGSGSVLAGDTFPSSSSSHASEAFIGSRTVACRMIDRGGKGYITADDLMHVLVLMGEDTDHAEEMVTEMMKAVDGDPSTESRRVTYEQMARLVPPLCPARKFQAGEELYKEGDVDPTYYLLRKGVVEFSVSTPVGRVPLQTQGPGASFGEVELLRADGSTAPRLATCRCLGRPGGGGCEALVMRGHLFSLLTDVFGGVRATLETQAEDRLTQLAGSVLQNGFSGYEQSVAGREVIWNDLQAGPGGSANKPFALLVLEGSVTAFFGHDDGGGERSSDDASGGEGALREQILGPGQFCFCGEGKVFGPGAPEAPTLVSCRPWQTARVLRVPAAEFRALMEKRNMAALTEFMLDQ